MTANFSDVAKTDKNFAVETKLDREDLVLYDVGEAPFRVYGLFRENGKYCRLPRAVAEKVNKGVLARHANTAGGRVRFITDSSFVAIVAKMENVGRMAHFPLTASAGFDLYADGVFIKSFVPDKNMEDGYESLISLNGKEMREITIHFPLYSDVCRLHVGLEEGAEVKEASPYRNKKPVVFYGSSITQGACASRPGTCYTNALCRILHYDHINLGFSGSAKGEDAITAYIENLEMGIFVLDYDHNAPTAEHLKNTHEKMFQRIRNRHPALPIVMLTRPKDLLTEKEEVRLQIVRETYERARERGDENVYFVDGRELAVLCGGEGTVDRCHPTDWGFASMTQALLPLFEKIQIETVGE